MADIELLIKIPEELYCMIQNRLDFNGDLQQKDNKTLMLAIDAGIPLPKGHGKLLILSEDAVKREQTPLSFSCQNWISVAGLSSATVAIIETDQTESEAEE